MLAYYFHNVQYGNFYWLYHFMIAPAHQGRGAGQAAIKLAVKDMQELGAQEIVANCANKNIRALHIYKKLGFQEYRKMDGGDFLLGFSDNAR